MSMLGHNSRVSHRSIGFIPGCIPAKHDRSLLEIGGIGVESTAAQFCEAIRRYVLPSADPMHMDERSMFAIMGARHVLTF